MQVNFTTIFPCTQNTNILVVPDSASLDGFHKNKWILQIYADSANNLRNPLTFCGFHLQLQISP